MNPVISIISPVYNAEKIIDELIRRIICTVEAITLNYEIVLVDDCGPDNSWNKIMQQSLKNSKIKGVKLSRNFGQHFAITAGIDQALGDYIVVIDCDLQDDPKYIIEMFAKAQDGFDIVYTLKKRRKHSFFKNITARVFNSMFNYLVENDNFKGNNNIGAYSLINRKVADAYKLYPDYHRHYLMVLRWLGFHYCYITIDHDERYSGKSSYTFYKLLQHAINGITSQSDKLLRIFVNIGLFTSLLSFISIIVIIFLYFSIGFKSGWSSMVSVLLFSTGMILTGIGILGIYLGKTFEQTKNRPKYIIDKKIN
jgi:glycosyltransferase involved in cell wall biosynthesis